MKREPTPVVPAPITIGDVRRVLEMIDASPTTAKARLSVHELRGVADVLRVYLASTEEPNDSPAGVNYKAELARVRAMVASVIEQDDEAARAATPTTCDIGPLRNWLEEG